MASRASIRAAKKVNRVAQPPAATVSVGSSLLWVWLFAAGMIIASVAYSPALNGPFVFDDRKLDRRLDLDRIFSLRYQRKVGNDHVIRVGPGLKVQLPPLPGHKGFAGRMVQVCHAPDGCIRVYLDDRLLLLQAADPWAGPVRALDMQRSTAPRKKKPLRVYTFAGRPAVRT